ncbi:MAG: hypothetical protein ACTSPB_00645 [Candidatus Thorarchaeota archaeon]
MVEEKNIKKCDCASSLKTICYNQFRFCPFDGVRIHGVPKHSKLTWNEVDKCNTFSHIGHDTCKLCGKYRPICECGYCSPCH